SFDKLLKGKVRIAEGIPFIIAAIAVFFKGVFRQRPFCKFIPVLFRYGVGPVIVRCLNNSKKRVLLLRENLISIQEYIFVANAPDINFFRVVIVLFEKLEPFNIEFQQPADIGPAGASPDKIKLRIAFKGIQYGALIDQRRVTTRRFRGLHIRYARNGSPHATRCPVSWRKTVIEEYARFAQRIKERGGVQGVAPHAAFITTET